MINLELIKDGRTLLHIDDKSLIRRFKIKGKSNKTRNVNDPIPELKEILQEWNSVITEYYIEELKKNNISHIPHAYLPDKSIKTNASIHTNSDVVQFDFKGFYDSCKYEYFNKYLEDIDRSLTSENEHIIKRLLIDPKTGGVTQGLPVSGALAGLSLIPFWVELNKSIPKNIRFTQYSDDLTFSFVGKMPKEFTIPILTQKIYESLNKCNLSFKLNDQKTRIEKEHYRKVTGVRINHHNQMTPSRKDYRFLRHALFILSKSDDLNKELAVWGFKSKAAFVGKISYIRSIDDTGKINNIIMKYRHTCRKHDIFTKWIDDFYTMSAFA